jgi:hypothetical protein
VVAIWQRRSVTPSLALASEGFEPAASREDRARLLSENQTVREAGQVPNRGCIMHWDHVSQSE